MFFLFHQIYCKFVKCGEGGCSNAINLGGGGGLTKQIDAFNGGSSGYWNELSISLLAIVPFHKELPGLLLEPLQYCGLCILSKWHLWHFSTGYTNLGCQVATHKFYIVWCLYLEKFVDCCFSTLVFDDPNTTFNTYITIWELCTTIKRTHLGIITMGVVLHDSCTPVQSSVLHVLEGVGPSCIKPGPLIMWLPCVEAP